MGKKDKQENQAKENKSNVMGKKDKIYWSQIFNVGKDFVNNIVMFVTNLYISFYGIIEN